jgi:BolA protein
VNTEQRLEEIRERLERAFKPESLLVEDEGHKHIGHEGAKDGRGHFRIMIVSEAFNGSGMLARHRAIYREMRDLMSTAIPALAIEAVAADEL